MCDIIIQGLSLSSSQSLKFISNLFSSEVQVIVNVFISLNVSDRLILKFACQRCL